MPPAETVQVGPSQASSWKIHSPEPVIKAGDLRDKGLWNDPSVLKTTSSYVMYFTTSVQEPFKPPILPFRATSADGIRWSLQPTEPLLSINGTPFVSAETPSVIEFKGEYHMYFTGIYPDDTVTPMAIGHATSTNGIDWTVDKKPLLTATGNAQAWNGYLVAEPGAIVIEDRVYVYFSAVGARAGGNPPQYQTIGLITSPDGVRFDQPRMVLEQSATYPASKGYVGYSTPAAFAVGGRIHLAYSVAHFSKPRNPQWQQIAIHHASSPDGETAFVQDSKPILTTTDLSWTSGEVLAPTVLVEGNEVKMWFAGHVPPAELGPLINRGFKGSEFGIGLASIAAEKLAPAAP